MQTLRQPHADEAKITVDGGTIEADTLVINAATGVPRVEIRGGAVSGSPVVSVGAGGTLQLSSSTSVVAALASLTVDEAGGGLVDLGAGGLLIAAGGITQADLLTDLVAGRGDGSWNGTSGITSSAATTALGQSIPRTVGWFDNGDGSLSVAFTAPGDTNLDWSIDILDAANFLALGKFDTGVAANWLEGDFSYDGIVDILDAADFFATGLFDAGNYNTLSSASIALPTAAVPEPSSLAMVLAAVAAVCGRVWLPRGGCRSTRGGAR